MTNIKSLVSRITKDEKGVTTVEYAVMLVLVAIAVAAATPGLSAAVITVFTNMATAL